MSAVFDRRYVKRLDGPNVKKGANKREMADQLRDDMQPLQAGARTRSARHDLVRQHRGLPDGKPRRTQRRGVRKGLEANDPAIPSSMIYAYAAIKGVFHARTRRRT